MTPSILIIGAGNLGTAMAQVLAPTGVPISFWDSDPAKATVQSPLAAAAGASHVLYCAPAHALRETLRLLVPSLQPEAVFISLAKGLEPGTSCFTHQVLAEELGSSHPYALMSGPMLASQLAQGTRAVIAPANPQASRIFEGTVLRTELSDDLQGLAAVGVIKNVYALCLGVAQGLGATDNQRGCLLKEIINEFSALAVRLGAQPETVAGYAGLGDLLATGLSDASTNVSAGREWVAKAGQGSKPCEGRNALRPLANLLGEELPSFAIAKIAATIFLDGQDPSRLILH